jgi:hypothetical protein
MTILGVSVLGDLNKPSSRQDALGLAFWRIIISAGILSLIMSLINLIAVRPPCTPPSVSSVSSANPVHFQQSFVFADKESGVSARHVRSYGAVAPHKVDRVSSQNSQRSFKLGLDRQDSLPTYRSPRPTSVRKGARFPLKISAPISDHESFPKSPKESDIVAPDLAHHPAMMYTETV